VQRLIVLVATLALAAATARLGGWQLDRAAQKQSLQAAIETRGAAPPLAVAELARDAAQAEAQLHRRVRLEGTWRADATVFLDNRQMNGRPGFFVVTPVLLDDGTAVLVQRGWLPRDPHDRTRVATLATPPGRIRLDGRIAAPPSTLMALGAEEAGPIRQNLDPDAFAREFRLRLRPLSVSQLEPAVGSDVDAELLRQWPAPAAGTDKHFGYAFQWFALSALTIGLYVWFQLIRPRLRRRPAA
jgi:surfeit locus 1 family protein